jgi:hypothetical protein
MQKEPLRILKLNIIATHILLPSTAEAMAKAVLRCAKRVFRDWDTKREKLLPLTREIRQSQNAFGIISQV